jgi:hypothetical protein
MQGLTKYYRFSRFVSPVWRWIEPLIDAAAVRSFRELPDQDSNLEQTGYIATGMG